jgi:small basic protein
VNRLIIAMVIGLGIGLVLGFALNVTYPSEFSFYITMALLAAMDSLLGAVRSQMEGKYNNLIFISGFLVNAILAAALVYLGDRLGVPLYYAVIFVFGGRLFQNLAVIRRMIIDRYLTKKSTGDHMK